MEKFIVGNLQQTAHKVINFRECTAIYINVYKE